MPNTSRLNNCARPQQPPACARARIQGSTILGVVIPEQRAQKAWTEGVAIWVSMLIVVLVGEQRQPGVSRRLGGRAFDAAGPGGREGGGRGNAVEHRATPE